MLNTCLADTARSARFAQILVLPNTLPTPVFGELIVDQNKYAVSYEDSSRKIPVWARLKLSPHNRVDMYGIPCTSYMVLLRASPYEPREEFDNLAIRYERAGLAIAAIHDVHRISEQNGANGKGRITRTIMPNQALYYSCTDPLVGYQENLGAFRQTVVRQLLRDESHETLQDFKHIVQHIKIGHTSEYQYMLPANLPSAFLDRIQEVKLDVTFGRMERHAVFKIKRHEPNVLPFRPRIINDPEETGIISVYKHFALHPEQSYLEQVVGNGTAQLVHFDSPSTTCAEKCVLLNDNANYGKETQQRWSLDRIVSAGYFESPNGYVILVGPLLNEILQPEQFLMKVTNTENIKRSLKLPNEMDVGTCTPFVYALTGKEAVDRIVLLDLPEQLMEQLSDYSIGGQGPSAHRASIQMMPITAKQVLTSQFGSKVVSIPHPLY
jgi:hypothetical protein